MARTYPPTDAPVLPDAGGTPTANEAAGVQPPPPQNQPTGTANGDPTIDNGAVAGNTGAGAPSTAATTNTSATSPTKPGPAAKTNKTPTRSKYGNVQTKKDGVYVATDASGKQQAHMASKEGASAYTESQSKKRITDPINKKISAVKSIPQKAEDKWGSLKNQTMDRLQKTGDELVKSAIDQVLDKIVSLMVIPEPVLLQTLKGIAGMGGRPDYQNNYTIIEMIKKDYKTIIEWFVDEFNYSLTSGKQASTFVSSAKYGATRCAIYVLKKRFSVLGEEWYRKGRYNEIKKIICGGKMNFSANEIKGIMDNGLSGDPSRLDKEKTIYSGFGETGCEEFGKKFMFTKGEVDTFLPEKKSKSGLYWETYPKTMEHVELMKKMLGAGGTVGWKQFERDIKSNVLTKFQTLQELEDQYGLRLDDTQDVYGTAMQGSDVNTVGLFYNDTAFVGSMNMLCLEPLVQPTVGDYLERLFIVQDLSQYDRPGTDADGNPTTIVCEEGNVITIGGRRGKVYTSLPAGISKKLGTTRKVFTDINTEAVYQDYPKRSNCLKVFKNPPLEKIKNTKVPDIYWNETKVPLPSEYNVPKDIRMVHKIIHKRIYENLIVFNPVVKIVSDAVGSYLKETGLSKVIDIVQNPAQLMVLYIKQLKKDKLL